MTDYIYALNEEENEVESVKDVVMSLGEYTYFSFIRRWQVMMTR